jgi:hypothetical protein
VLGGIFRLEEDAHGYFLLLRQLIRRYGLPTAAYTDRHGIFHRDPRTPLPLAAQLQGRPESTQVGRALQELGIRWIPARSPQGTDEIVKHPASTGGECEVRYQWTRVTPGQRAGSGDGSPAAQVALRRLASRPIGGTRVLSDPSRLPMLG